jgi:phosphate starvation-inducible membrane PsiE
MREGVTVVTRSSLLGTGSGIVSVRMATPLMVAAYGGSDAAVRYLIVQHGVGLDRVLVQCFIALMVAAMCGHCDMVQTLSQ